MKFRVLNRVSKEDIPFKDNLYNLLSVKGNRLILGYGYISDFIFYNDNKEFYESIYNGFKDEDNPELIIVGANNKDYESNYICLGYDILKYFNDNKEGNNKLKVSCYISNKYNYHKKIAVKYNIEDEKTELLSSIIGSSNLSGNTLNPKSPYYFTEELDIVFWNQFYKEIDSKFSIVDNDLEIKYNISYTAEKDINENIKRLYEGDKFKKKELDELDILYKIIDSYNNIKFNRKYLDDNKGKFFKSIFDIKDCNDVRNWCNVMEGAVRELSTDEQSLKNVIDYTKNYYKEDVLKSIRNVIP